MKPRALKPGDTIGIAASASPFVPEDFHQGVKNLKALGFSVYYRDDIFDKKHYLAGTDKRRAEELIELIKNPDIKAILFARGGYGMLRVLPHLQKEHLPATPKIILGYSDITPLLNFLYQNCGWTTFYGPVVAKDLSSTLNEDTKQHFFKAVTQTKPLAPFQFDVVERMNSGVADGIIVGGCLSLVVATLGTKYEIDTNDKILLLEDINEKPYAVDRMLTQLLLAGKFEKVRGIVFGNFVKGGEPNHYKETVEDVLKDFKKPILLHFPAGHGPVKVTLPLGIRVRLDAAQKKLEYLENACG